MDDLLVRGRAFFIVSVIVPISLPMPVELYLLLLLLLPPKPTLSSSTSSLLIPLYPVPDSRILCRSNTLVIEPPRKHLTRLGRREEGDDEDKGGLILVLSIAKAA